MMRRWWLSCLTGIVLAALTAGAWAQEDPYETYVKTSKDFKPVKQDKDWLLKAYPSWVFMPWYYQWTVGYDDKSGEFCKSVGINGAFIDHGNPAHLDWIDKFNLKFYVDHTAGKGDLHQWDGGKDAQYTNQINGTGVRVKPVNDAMKTKLEGIIKKNINNVKASPNRAAYALDDEISWGHFVKPCMWNLTDDKSAYQNWLKEIYGPKAPTRTTWVSYNDILPQVGKWDVASFDASPVMDQWTFNDSYWNNFLGDLVTYANTVDPATPMGHVGGQSPNTFGGYDYAKQMRKIQYIEAYNIAGAQSVIRSFNPHNAIATVTTYFHVSLPDGVWAMWYYLAQGNRGHIAWVEKWFNDDKTPKSWLTEIGPTFLEIGGKISPAMSGSEWKHDGVALYYSHPSIQMSWVLDAVAHGKTWTNRKSDSALGTSHKVRQAWMNMLRDEGLQFNWVSYADVVANGVPAEYKVLILPAVYCLSDAEARKIKAFVENGGTVVADFMPGLWDQHGKGREAGGVLDELFGVKHDPKMTAKDVFNGDGKLWVEVDQDANYSEKNPKKFLTNANSCVKDASGFNKAVLKMDVVKVNKVGKGTAVLMNLSPQWYNVYRLMGPAEAAKRGVFLKPLHDAGLDRWVALKGDGKEFGYEITYWVKGDRTFMFVIANNDVAANELGGGAAVGLKTDKVPVTVSFAKDMKNVRDERAGKDLGNGKDFKVTWTMNEAVVFSFDNK